MINTFREQHKFLSNFQSIWIVYEDIPYPSSEHAYQAAKSLDLELRGLISRYPTPGQTKRAAKTFEIRSDWNEVRVDIMYNILKIKFANPFMREKLLETGDQELIEGNLWCDNFWGVCGCKKCPGIGENTLGKLLMKIRGEIRASISDNQQSKW